MNPELAVEHPKSELRDVNGIRMNVVDIGSGQPILFIHGAGPGTNASYSFGTVLDDLAQRYRVIAADMPGYGKSGDMVGDDVPANVAKYCLALLDDLGVDRAILVGHSRGGRIATELTFAAPERVDLLFVVGSGSVSPDGHKSMDGEWTAAAKRVVEFGSDGKSDFESFKAARVGSVLDPEVLGDEFLRASYDFLVESGNLERYVAQMKANDSLNFYHRADGEAFRTKLRSISVPMCLLHGREDAIAPYERSLALIELVPTVEYHLIPNCGHSPILEYPEIFTTLLDDAVRRRVGR